MKGHIFDKEKNIPCIKCGKIHKHPHGMIGHNWGLYKKCGKDHGPAPNSGNHYHIKGHPAWSKGLTKETNKSLKHASEKISKYRIEWFKFHKHPLKGVPRTEKVKKKIQSSVNRAYDLNPSIKNRIKYARAKQILPKKDTKIEIAIQKALAENNISFTKHKSFSLSDGTTHQVDLFIEPNICIEADGDYYHRYPTGTERDKFVNKELMIRNFSVLRFWEHDIVNNINAVIKEIKKKLEIQSCVYYY